MDAIARSIQRGIIMREILFRGKRTDNGEWVHGYYGCIGGMYHYIYTGKIDITKGFVDHEKYEVDFETVGQYTGMHGKNGKIFEGDYWIDEEGDILVVEFRNCQFCFVIYGYDDELFGFSEVGELDCDPLDYYYINKIEFAGNIHDNPELLKGKE